MTRTRSSSLVAQIAKHVTSESSDLDNFRDIEETPLNIESLPRKTVNSRSQSFSIPKCSKPYEAKYPLFPFLEEEIEGIKARTKSKWNIDNYLDNEQICLSFDDEEVLNFRECCVINSNQINSMVSEIDNITESLSSLVLQYNHIEREAREFAEKSAHLLEKREHLKNLCNEIENNLEIYESLDGITKYLSTPSKSLVKRSSFTEIVDKLENALVFLKEHPNFKENELYEMRFRQCMTRALTLIRNFLIDTLSDQYSELTSKLEGSTLEKYSKTVSTALLYTEFTKSFAEESGKSSIFCTLFSDIERSFYSHEEYRGLLNDVLNKYFKVRGNLLHDYIKSQIDSFNEEGNSLLLLFQEQISFVHKLLQRELTVFKVFFLKPENSRIPEYLSPMLYSWYKQILEPFYDRLRLDVIHEKDVSTLCELISLLSKYYEFEQENSDSDFTPEEEEINYGQIFQPVVQIVQSRLSFLIHSYDVEMHSYKPTVEDFGFDPKMKLELHIKSDETNPNMEQENELISSLYYPLRKAFSMMYEVYQVVSLEVFGGLLFEIVSNSIAVLKAADTKVGQNKSPLIRWLFYLKNLISIQKIIISFGIDNFPSDSGLEIDMTKGVAEIFETLRKGKFLQTYNRDGGFMDLFKQSLPKLVKNREDQSDQLDSELNNSVLGLINEVSQGLTSDIKSVKDSKSIKAQSDSFKNKIETALPETYSQICNYISDEKIAEHLLDNIINLVALAYDDFFKEIEQRMQRKEIMSADITDLMEVDTVASFAREEISRHKFSSKS